MALRVRVSGYRKVIIFSETRPGSYVYMGANNRNIKNASRKHGNGKILIPIPGPIGKEFHSGRERRFVLVIIPNGVHATHPCGSCLPGCGEIISTACICVLVRASVRLPGCSSSILLEIG